MVHSLDLFLACKENNYVSLRPFLLDIRDSLESFQNIVFGWLFQIIHVHRIDSSSNVDDFNLELFFVFVVRGKFEEILDMLALECG